MSDTNDVSLFYEQFVLLRQEYGHQLSARISELDGIWQELALETRDRVQLVELHRRAHSLAGSGGTFGFSTLSKVARLLEGYLTTLIDQDTITTSLQHDQISACIERLRESLDEPDPLEIPLGSDDLRITTSAATPVIETANRLIFVLESDPEIIEGLVRQIGHFGYIVRPFTQFFAMHQALVASTPAAIILNIQLVGAEAKARALLAEIQQVYAIPLIFVAERGDLDARLQAVRAGGQAYFTKPVEVSALIDRLDVLTSHRMFDPYRILIVEDEPQLASYYELVLKRAGMLTTVVLDPFQVAEPLSEFRPDLVLMDVYMPGCNGLDLAKVIRQQETYLSIPIVYLSSEINQDKQMQAMQLGGDDFLTKPINPDHLIESVKSRASRSRILRSFMVRDSLTGLLNHTKIKEQLDVEIARAQRQNSTLAFAMIDIDHFKSVNDTYGHPTGDRVLKSLSRLLQQRLRKTDIIGRYGGEEFAVIFYSTTGAIAYRILNEIRIGFAQIRQQADTMTFSTTFSCGVAEFPRFPDVLRISDAADKALYRAKRSGRNRVELAVKE